MLALALLFSPTAQAADDCALDTDDYVALRRSLRKLAVAQGHPVAVAGSTAQCDAAVADVVRNDPLLAVQHPDGDGSGWDRVQGQMSAYVHCGAVVVPGDDDAFALRTVGECIAPLSPGDSPHRILSAAWWAPGGVSLRWTEALGGGLAVLADGAVQLDPAALSPQQRPAWRALGGVDLSELGLLTSMVIGARFGVQHRGEAGPGAEELVGQLHLGRRWVGRRLALQVGGGVTAVSPVVPTVEGMTTQGIGPSLELRLGVPSGW